MKKIKDLIIISDGIELEALILVSEAEIIGIDETIKIFKELAKSLKITKVSDLYLSLIKSNCTKITNYMLNK